MSQADKFTEAEVIYFSFFWNAKALIHGDELYI